GRANKVFKCELLLLEEITQRWSHSAAIAADRLESRLHNRNAVPFSAVPDIKVGKHESAQLLRDRIVVLCPNICIEFKREVRDEIVDGRRIGAKTELQQGKSICFGSRQATQVEQAVPIATINFRKMLDIADRIFKTDEVLVSVSKSLDRLCRVDGVRSVVHDDTDGSRLTDRRNVSEQTFLSAFGQVWRKREHSFCPSCLGILDIGHRLPRRATR